MEEEDQVSLQRPLVALIVGVTGMAGLSLAESLKSPKALGAPWKVYGSARRDKPTSWFPSSLLDGYISFDAADADDTRDKLAPLSDEVTHVFWVAIQVRETEEANITVNSAMLGNVLNVLKSSPTSRLSHVTLQTGTKHYMGPIYDPSYPTPKPHEPPFVEDSPRLPYPNFYYALEDLVASYAPSLTYSVHRSSIIIGASPRSVYNTLLTLATYASICRHEGLVFRFPGTKYTWEHFGDMSDARLLAEQQIWAAVTPGAKNQAFNCTNGDVFTWKSLWKVVCDVFHLEFVPFDEYDKFDFVKLMEEKGKVWDEIVEKHGLCKTKLEEITCPAALSSVLYFDFQHVCSMNKSREFGFLGFANTLKSLGMWVERLREMKIIPSI
ncbi:hypothetical protein CCACVL1_28547 [Corchorus capsularis]|uniref:PRISE-like Rossmann-fold domain-containing protein n=1 Tax=Corchorus capsularis TaxID=210143 RepID=A0A1R3G677_COCAP|nr:hypothetical protein CCACVL1_28547 [Corchorus capsularis]